MAKKPSKLEKAAYTVEVNYSPRARKEKLMRFTAKGGPFEISANEMSTMLIGQVNSDLVEATFVESDRVNVVEVTRQIRARADRDIRAGDEIRIDYTHPYPVEFAVIEEAAKLAKINMDVPALTLTVDYIKAVKAKVTPQQRRFVDLVYKFFRNLTGKKEAAPAP